MLKICPMLTKDVFPNTKLPNVNINIDILIFLMIAPPENVAFEPDAPIRINTAFMMHAQKCLRISRHHWHKLTVTLLRLEITQKFLLQ